MIYQLFNYFTIFWLWFIDLYSIEYTIRVFNYLYFIYCMLSSEYGHCTSIIFIYAVWLTRKKNKKTYYFLDVQLKTILCTKYKTIVTTVVITPKLRWEKTDSDRVARDFLMWNKSCWCGDISSCCWWLIISLCLLL